MTIGPGKYDAEATYVRKRTEASTVIVAVLDGNQGNGFSVQTVDPRIAFALPMMLRDMADKLEADMREKL